MPGKQAGIPFDSETERMEWLLYFGASWKQSLLWMAGLSLLFALLARLAPCNSGMYWWRDMRAVATDFVYWFFAPFFLGVARTLMLMAGVVLVYRDINPYAIPAISWPLWSQCLAVLLLQDVMLYWLHRLFHGKLGWRFHAIHHSPETLDWMSTVRFHPVNFLLEFTLVDVAAMLMGFSPAAIVALMPFNLVYSAMVHANLNWTFGPLRHILASPVFHRWHHSTRPEAINKNFASTFPFLDVLFGTYHLPPGQLPEQFGNGDPDFPEGFWGQLIYPLRIPGELPVNFTARQARNKEGSGRLSAPGTWIVVGILTLVCVVAGTTFWAEKAPPATSTEDVTSSGWGPTGEEPVLGQPSAPPPPLWSRRESGVHPRRLK